MSAIPMSFEVQIHGLTVALRALRESITEAFLPVLTRLADATQRVLDFLVQRTAIEQYDIAESDIRRVDGFTVVLWNRRRIEIDPARLVIVA